MKNIFKHIKSCVWFSVLVVWVSAVFLAYFATHSFKEGLQRETEKNEKQLVINSFPSVNVDKQPATPFYAQIQKKMEQIYKNKVVVSVNGNNVEIKVNNVEDYLVFKNVLVDMQSSNEKVKWEVVSMCAGRKCGNPAYRAILQGYILELKVLRGGGDKSL